MAANIFSIIVLFLLSLGALNLFFFMLAVYPKALLIGVIIITLLAGYHDFVILKRKSRKVFK